MSRKRRRGSCLESYPLTGDKKCDCRSPLIRPFKLLRSREMIDARIPHLHRKSGNRSCLAMLSVRRENISLGLHISLAPPPLPFTPTFPFFLLVLFPRLPSVAFRKAIYSSVFDETPEFTIIDISTRILSNFLWRTLRNNFNDSAEDRLYLLAFVCSRRRGYDLLEYQRVPPVQVTLSKDSLFTSLPVTAGRLDITIAGRTIFKPRINRSELREMPFTKGDPRNRKNHLLGKLKLHNATRGARMEKSRVNGNCAHTFSRKYLPVTFKNANAISPRVSRRVTAVETLKQTVAQYFNENVSALTHRQIISDRPFLGGINAVADSSSIASFLRLYGARARLHSDR